MTTNVDLKQRIIGKYNTVSEERYHVNCKGGCVRSSYRSFKADPFYVRVSVCIAHHGLLIRSYFIASFSNKFTVVSIC